MKIVSVKYVHELTNKILGETELGGSLSDREQAILHAGFHKLIDRLYATSDNAPEVLEFLQELTVIASGLTKRATDGDYCACDPVAYGVHGSYPIKAVCNNCGLPRR